MEEKFVWIFHGMGGKFASGVFDDEKGARKWIEENKLQGVLTKYPINTGVYEWAIKNKFFEPKDEKERKPEFIQKFTSGSQEHFHFEND
jgi:hypothetical protein